MCGDIVEHDKHIKDTGICNVTFGMELTALYKTKVHTLVVNKEVGIDDSGTIRIKINERFFRPCEVDLLLGDSSKAERELGWVKEFDTLDKLIVDMFE